MGKEIISIIIPAYNASKTIEKCVDSILGQTFSKFKIYIVDDSSTDNTWDILERLTKIDDRIVIFRNDNNLGPSCSRNYAIEKCQGEWICFIDSDDYIDADYLNKMYSAHDEADIIISSFIQVDEKANCLKKYIVSDKYSSKHFSEALDKAYGGKDDLEFVYNLCWNKLFRRKLFSDVRFPEGRLQEDAYVMAYLFYNMTRPIVAISDAIYYYVDYSESTSHRAQNGISDMLRRIDLVFLYKSHIRLHKLNNNLLYKRSRANLLNNIITIYRLHYKKYYKNHRKDFSLLKKDFNKHYFRAVLERNPNLSGKLLLSWIIFFVSPSLYLKYI